MIYTNPLYSLLRTLFYFATGRVQFDKATVGQKIVMKDGKEFIIFRRIIIKYFFNKDKRPKGLFIVRFKPTMDAQKNIKLSKVLLPFFVGFKGFRSKYWCINEESGECQGVYEWDTIKDVERYSRSIAVNNMTKRSVPGSISFQILDNDDKNRSWKIVDLL